MTAIKRLTDWNSDDDADPAYTPDSFEFQTDLNDVLRSHDAMLAALNKIAGGFIDSAFVMSKPPDWHSAYGQLQAIARAAITTAEAEAAAADRIAEEEAREERINNGPFGVGA